MKTVWLLDVDGVLNASRSGWSAPPRTVTAYADGRAFRLRFETKLLMRIKAVHDSGRAEVRWATTWCDHAAELHRVLPFGPFEVAFGKRPISKTYDEQKIDAALGVLDAGDRLIWTDDSVVPIARRAYPQFDRAEMREQALLIAPHSSRGLRPEHMDEIEAFAALGDEAAA